MTNFMFLSPDVNSLVDYFNKSFGGSLEVEGQYESLESNMESLMNNNIRADKLIIVFKDQSGFNIKREIACLGKLLDSNYFFKINEILLFSEDSSYCMDGIASFKFVMENSNFTNYSIKVYEDGISTAQVYKDVMGIVPDDFTTTSHTIVYRREIGSESKVGYSPRRINHPIVKSVDSSYNSYEVYKENMKKTETGRVVVENDPKEIPNIDIKLEQYKSNIDAIRNIVIVTGNDKSGTSVLVSNIFVQTESNSLLIDLSKGLGSIRILNYLKESPLKKTPSIDFIENKDLLFDDFKSRNLKVLQYNKKENLLDYLKYVLSIPNRINFDNIYIDCDLEDLEDVIHLVDQRLKKLIFTTESSIEEFSLLQDMIRKFDRFDSYLFMNNHLNLDEGYTELLPSSVTSMFSGLNVVKGENLFKRSFDLSIFI